MARPLRIFWHPVSRWVYKIALTAIFLVFVNRSLTGADLWVLRARVDPVGVALAAVLCIASIGCQVRRWEIILRSEGFRIGRRTALQTVLFGYSLAFMTPGRVGELFRGLPFAKNRKADAVFAAFADKLFSIAATLAVGALCVLLQVSVARVGVSGRFGVGAGILTGVCLALGILIACTRGRLAARWPGSYDYPRRLLRLWPSFTAGPGRDAALWSLAAQGILVVQTSLLLAMFGSRDPSANLLAAGQAYVFMTFMPFFIGNMGIREYSFGMFLTQLSAQTDAGMTVTTTALGASIGILVINLIVPALAGVAWMLLNRTNTEEKIDTCRPPKHA
jgi:hypothetical protein